LSQEPLPNALVRGAEKVLSMKLRDFVRLFKDLIPPFDYVMEDDPLEEVLKLLFGGKHYIIVLDRRGRLKGLITYIDLVTLFSKAAIKSAQHAFGSLRELLKSAGVSIGTHGEILAGDLMERLPHWVFIDETVEDAIDLMHRDRCYHAVIRDKEGMVYGVITYHSIFRAIVREAGIYLPQEQIHQ